MTPIPPSKGSSRQPVQPSPAFRQTINLLPKLAACTAPVLLHGATGTGKELFTRAIHYLSRRTGPSSR